MFHKLDLRLIYWYQRRVACFWHNYRSWARFYRKLTPAGKLINLSSTLISLKVTEQNYISVKISRIYNIFRSPKTTPLKTVANQIALQKNVFIWSSDQIIYYAEMDSAGLRSRKLSHVKSDVIQIEMSTSYHILICTSGKKNLPKYSSFICWESILLAKRNEPVEVIAELPQFSATITGACFDRDENVIFTDTSGCIRTINEEGETLWETTLGYQVKCKLF